jgi:hypothetical protein
MPSDLRIPILRGRALLEIHPLEDRVFSKAMLDRKHRFLYFLLPFLCRLGIGVLLMRGGNGGL